MPVLNYSQGGITNEVLEDLRRRQRERGQAAPYRPSMSGLSEQDTEQAINRAQVSGEDAGEAVQTIRERSRMQLRAPMSDMQPAQSPGALRLEQPMTGAPQAMRPQAPSVANVPSAPADMPAAAPQAPVMQKRPSPNQLDEAMMQAAQRNRRGIAIASAISALFGSRENDQTRMALTQQALQANDPREYQQRIEARQAQGVQDAAAKGEEALDADYRRTLMRSMDTNANRREFEMARRTDADSRLYDPNHPVAQQRREFLRRIMASAPEIARGLEGQDLDALGSADLRNMTQETLRRIQATPNRYRQADIDEMMRVAADLDAQDAATEAPQMAQPTTEAPIRTGTMRPHAAMPAGEPQAPTAAPRRDRTPQQIIADRIMERRGQPPPSGYSADDLTPGEAAMLARQSEARGSRGQMARIAAGIDTQSREAQNLQTQTGNFATSQDLARVERAVRPIHQLASQANAAIAEYERIAGGPNRPITQAQFEAMMRGGPSARLMGTSNLSALVRTFTNIQLHEQTGSAQTEGETARFFAALNMNSLADPAEFYQALKRMRRAALRDLNSIRSSNPAAYDRIIRGGER